MDEHEAAQPDSMAPIEHEITVAVSRERAWDAYVHGLGEWWHRSWTRSGAALEHIEVEPHAGGRIIEHTRDGEAHVWGEVTDAVAGERFEHTLGAFHEGDPSVVTVAFEELPHGGTRVRCSHGGWNESNRQARATYVDWPLQLDRYRAHAQHV